MKSTEAKPGKPIVMKLREDEESQVMNWLNLQGMYSDSIRYLIQKEIAENGLRNLQLYVPQARTIDSIKLQMSTKPIKQFNHNVVEASSNISVSPSYQSAVERESTLKNAQHLSPTNSQTDDKVDTRDSFVEIDEKNKREIADPPTVISKDPSEKEHIDQVSNNPGKRKASKQFGNDVADSYAN